MSKVNDEKAERSGWYQVLTLGLLIVVALVGWGISYGSLKNETKQMCVDIHKNRMDADRHFAFKRAKLENHDNRLTTVEVKLDYIVAGIDKLTKRLP